MTILREAETFEPGDVVRDKDGGSIRLTVLQSGVQAHRADRPLWIGIDLSGVHGAGDVVFTEAGWVDIAASAPPRPRAAAGQETASPEALPAWMATEGRGRLSDEQTRLEAEAAAHYASKATSESTADKYARSWRLFERWCSDRGIGRGLDSTGPDIAVFLAKAAAAGRRASTIDVYAAAIRYAFRAAGVPFPEHYALRLVIAGIRRENGGEPEKKLPLTGEHVRKIADLAQLNTGTLQALRDRAILLFGYASAMRRGELADLNVEDIDWRDLGVEVTIRRAKGDKTGNGQTVGIPRGKTAYCPLRALKAWLDAAEIVEGPVFRRFSGRRTLLPLPLSGQRIAQILKAYAKDAGLDPDLIGGHSLRRGWSTDVGKAGDLAPLLKQLRHKSAVTAAGYIKDGVLEGHPGADLL